MPPDRPDTDLLRLMEITVDPEWYKRRYPDVVAANQDPVQHFIQFGVAENRDPNRFFDSAWYLEHYPDVASSGFNPLLHYLRAGALELRNPHPQFDARYYVQKHPDAGDNPLLYHLRIGLARGYLTEDPIDIRDYLPVENLPALPRSRVLADVVIPICYSSTTPGNAFCPSSPTGLTRWDASRSSMTPQPSRACRHGCANWPRQARSI